MIAEYSTKLTQAKEVIGKRDKEIRTLITEKAKLEHVCYYLYNYQYNIYIHLIVVTWARGICLICMPKTRGPQARGLRAYISGKSRVPMLQLLCNTFLVSCAQAKSSVELQQLYL